MSNKSDRLITQFVRDYHIDSVKKDFVIEFGDISDGAIEFVGIVPGGFIEVGYFYGDTKTKNIVVASTQVGCPGKCSFCELGDQDFVRNLSSDEMFEQVVLMLQQAKSSGHDLEAKHKINWAKSGDCLFNPEFVNTLERFVDFGYSHKVSTVFPSGQKVMDRFKAVADFASQYSAPLQVQISLISTSEQYRQKAAGIRLASFQEIRDAAQYWRTANPDGRKINLSLMLTKQNPINIQTAVDNFPPELFRFRFRNYVPTQNGLQNNLDTIAEQRFKEIYKEFQDRGYEVGTWATPTPVEQKFGLASNVTLRRYLQIIAGKI
jgi:hypothetical protein